MLVEGEIRLRAKSGLCAVVTVVWVYEPRPGPFAAAPLKDPCTAHMIESDASCG